MPTERTSILTPLHPLFSILNWVAFVGWSFLLLQLTLRLTSAFKDNDDDETNKNNILETNLGMLLFFLESICLVEVFRIALRDLPGNLVLGAVLHAMRWTALLVVLPSPAASSASMPVLWSWALTEVTRYPMYLAPNNGTARAVRMVAPLLTFPVGCAAEARGAWLVLFHNDDDDSATLSLPAKMALYAMLFVNGVLGPTQAYPALLKKGLPVLGFGRKPSSSSTPSSSSKKQGGGGGAVQKRV